MNGLTNGNHAVVVQVASHDPSSVRNASAATTQLPTKGQTRASVLSLLCNALVVITTGLLFGSLYLEYFANTYLLPRIDLMRFTEQGKGELGLTYYYRHCGPDDLSTHDPTDLTVTKETPTDEALDMMLKHGATLLPGLLRKETAEPLRDFILKENQVNKELIHVIENKNRWSFPIQVDQDPSVTAALEELLSNEHLVKLLEALCGPDPAVIEFTAITAAEGAAQQFWHQDVTAGGSAAKYARHFVPSYSLFVPLQNTTAEMGATGICPGTHMCSNADFCDESGFQVSGRSNQWPMGAGALVNQQTTHRGEAHTKGPHRVVFILTFAPRPRVGPFTVETRMIGTSGSYSLHWSQWGHTLSDFRDPTRHMKLRSLRSLGLYKSKDRFWGWDYITTSLMRITHDESGFGEGDMEKFLKKGGLSWIPKFLQGSIVSVESSTENLWIVYLRNTLKKCQTALFVLHGFIVIVTLFLFTVAKSADSKKRSPSFLALLAIHFIWLFGIWSLHQHVCNTAWARNITRKFANQVPDSLSLAMETTRTTLPTLMDIMKFDKMKSSYMFSFERVLDVAHPGNAVFVKASEHFSSGYDVLTPQLQRKLRIDFNQTLHGQRVLAQTTSSGWAEVSEVDRDMFLHESLLRYTGIAALLQQVSFLLSESRFGFYRSSAMHKTHIPKLLLLTKEALLTYKQPHRRSACHPDKLRCETSTLQHDIRRSLFQRKRLGGIHGLIDLHLGFVTSPPPDVAFLSVGAPVEAIFGRDFDYWYRGKLIGAKPYRMKWVVQFEDGDVEDNACTRCVVPSYPYQIDERIEVSMGDPENHEYEEGLIVAVYSDLTVDVKVGDRMVKRARPESLRRGAFEQVTVSIGAKVLARYPGAGSTWYAGTIERINDNGSLAISYDDGDYLDEVSSKDVRLQ